MITINFCNNIFTRFPLFLLRFEWNVKSFVIKQFFLIIFFLLIFISLWLHFESFSRFLLPMSEKTLNSPSFPLNCLLLFVVAQILRSQGRKKSSQTSVVGSCFAFPWFLSENFVMFTYQLMAPCGFLEARQKLLSL